MLTGSLVSQSLLTYVAFLCSYLVTVNHGPVKQLLQLVFMESEVVGPGWPLRATTRRLGYLRCVHPSEFR